MNDSTLTGQQLAGAVELYLGDPTDYAMIQVTPDLKMHTWIKDERLIWPDTYTISRDGYMYITTSQINKQPDYNDGVNKRTSPYQVYKVKLPVH